MSKVKKEDINLILEMQVTNSDGACVHLSSVVRDFLSSDKGWIILQPNQGFVNKSFQDLLKEDCHEVNCQICSELVSTLSVLV